MSETVEARDVVRRIADTKRRLETDVDLWVATAHPEDGLPYLVPLSFLWDGTTLLIATPAASRTGQALAGTGKVRLGLGPTRDVVIIEAAAETIALDAIDDDAAARFAGRTGFDPRESSAVYRYFRLTPTRIQAWREENELAGRTIMRNGEWLHGE